MRMTCANCGNETARSQGFRVCLHCGLRIVDTYEVAAALPGVLDVSPHAIALPVAEYLSASRTYEKLHRLTDAAELLTRFCAAAVLADLLDRSPGHSFPEKLQEALLDRLERPTFCAWAGLLETAVNALPRKAGKVQCQHRSGNALVRAGQALAAAARHPSEGRDHRAVQCSGAQRPSIGNG